VPQEAEHCGRAWHGRPHRERYVPAADAVAVQLQRARGQAVGEHGELCAVCSDAPGGQLGVRGPRAVEVDHGAAGVVCKGGHGARVVDGEVGVEGGVQGGAGRGDANLGEAEHLECGDGRAWVKR